MKIKLHEHPFAPVEPMVFETPNLGEWLIKRYGLKPRVRVQVFRGEPSSETEITRNVKAILAGDAPEYTVLQSPGEGMSAYAVFQIIMAVVAVASYLLTPSPKAPGNVNRTQASPNNALSDRNNQIRILQRVEDIFGTVRSVPSLMMPTYFKYRDDQKFEYGYYCVGRGYHDIADLRDGNSLLSEIEGAAAAVYDPFTSPNSGDDPILQVGDAITDQIVTTSRSIEVDGLTLKAANQLGVPTPDSYSFIPDPAGDIISQSPALVFPGSGRLDFATYVQVGDTIVIAMDDEDVGEWHDALHDVVPEEEADHFHITGTVNYSGTRVVAAVETGQITLVGSTFTDELEETTALITVEGAPDEWTAWVTLPADDRTEVWANVIAPNGVWADAGGGKYGFSVNFELEVEQLDENLEPLAVPVVETLVGQLYGEAGLDPGDERATTLEHATSWTGPARVRMRRTSLYLLSFQGTLVDEIKWADLYSVSPVQRDHFGNKTTIHTITQATARATAVKTRQLNCLASRKLPIFDGENFSGAFDEDGQLGSGTIAATSKLVDIIAAVAVDPQIGNRDLDTDLDMAQIWAAQQTLDAWNTECGQFNYTLDTDNMSFEETVILIANAGFGIAYRQNGKIRLAVDYAQPESTALFTHRNKKPKAETITRRFANDAECDGVEFVYVDPDSNQPETITLPLDGNYTKLKKFEIAGIRSFTQAWLRANREYYKLIGQRVNIETSTTLDARSLLPNARIDIVDNTRFRSFDGEVVGQSGLTLTLSRDVEFAPSEPHSVVLMKRDGSLQSIAATEGAQPNQVVLSQAPDEAVVTTSGEAGIRTIFSFAADSDRGAMAYLVQEIDITDGQYAKIRAINYSDDYYQMDLEDIPEKGPIIEGDVVAPAETFYRLTESGGKRLTEIGQARIQE